MQRIVTGFATIFLSLTLWADMCMEVGEFIVEEKSLEPQVVMEVTNVRKDYVYNEDQGYGTTECTYYTDVLKSVWIVSYDDAGTVREVRELTVGDGLDASGTACTAPGIYLFRLQSPMLFKDTWNNDPPPKYCGFTFVYHNEQCPTQGALIEKADPDYSAIIDGSNCLNTIADAITESQKEEYQDASATADTNAGVDDDTIVADNDTKKAGCALTLL